MNDTNLIRRSITRCLVIFPIVAIELACHNQVGWAQTTSAETAKEDAKAADKTHTVDVVNEAELGIVAAPSPGRGVLIKAVFLGTPADRGGLRSGDFLIAINGQMLAHPTDYYGYLQQHTPGTSVELKIWRNEREFAVEVILNKGNLKWSPGRQAWVGIVLGDSASGRPAVRRVLPSSPAEEAGLQAGDIVLRFNGEKVSSNQELVELIGNLPAYSRIVLGIRRGEIEQEIEVATSSRFDAPWGWRYGTLHRFYDDLYWQWEELPEHDRYRQRFHDWRQQIDETMLRLRREVQRLRNELRDQGEGLPAKDRDSRDSSADRDVIRANSSSNTPAQREVKNIRQTSNPMLSRAPIALTKKAQRRESTELTDRFQYYGDYYRHAQFPQRTYRNYQSGYRTRYYEPAYPRAGRPYYYYHYFPGDVYFGRTLYEYDPRLDIEQRAYLWGQRIY